MGGVPLGPQQPEPTAGVCLESIGSVSLGPCRQSPLVDIERAEHDFADSQRFHDQCLMIGGPGLLNLLIEMDGAVTVSSSCR